MVVVSRYSTHNINKLFEEGIFKVHIQKEKLDYFSPYAVFPEMFKSLKRHSDFSWYVANKN